MFRRLDRYWFRLLAGVDGWVLRRVRAHCRREMLRRFPRNLAWQKAHPN